MAKFARPFFSCRRKEYAVSRQRGVALIEALISMLIFSVGVLGLMGLEARAVNFSVDAENRNRASLFANDIASCMWLAGSVAPCVANLPAYQASIVDPTNSASLPNGTVNVTAVGGSTNVADIVITWQPPSDAAAAIVSTFTTRVILQ